MTTNDAVRPVAWRGLWDSQWVNIVNHNECYRGWELEDAVNHAVKLTEKTLKENNASAIAHLQARVEALTGEVAKWKELASESVYVGLCIGHDCASMLATLQERGVYTPRCDDGKPSNADARRDSDKIKDVYYRGLQILKEDREQKALTQPEADHG